MFFSTGEFSFYLHSDIDAYLFVILFNFAAQRNLGTEGDI
jgi:hypothetical protein